MKLHTFAGVVAANFVVVVLSVQAQSETVKTMEGDEMPAYLDTRIPIEQRVDDLFCRLSQDEKLSLLTGTGFTTHPIERLGVPSMGMVDAGQGVRGGMDSTKGPATAFPCGVAMASTWDTNLIERIGGAIGVEARNKGTGSQVLLAPAVNIQRSPLGGRNGEYFSEDPFLAAQLGVAYIHGVQDTGVSACIKHYAANNEEDDRMYVDARVGERALREIYLPAFEAGVKEGNVWSLMSAYNKVNGPHCSANAYLLTDILKNEWGFDGLVMSDWGGVHETPVAQAGNDLEMPGGKFATVDKLKDALADGSLTKAAIDDSVRRILRTVVRVGLLDNQSVPNPDLVNSKAHQQLALEAARKGIILLKNEGGVLPLDHSQIKSIAVIGKPAARMQVGALGSPYVTPPYTVAPVDGIKKLVGDGIDVTYVEGPADKPVRVDEEGFEARYFHGTQFEGEPFLERIDPEIQFDLDVSPCPGIPAENYSVIWHGRIKAPTSGIYTFYFTGDDGFRVTLDGDKIIERWKHAAAERKSAEVALAKGHSYDVIIEYFQGIGGAVARFDWALPDVNKYGDAIAAAKAADVAVVCVGTDGTEGEGHDRPSMDLPDDQNELIQAVAAANPNTVVVINSGTPVSMFQWIENVPALIEIWFPGQEGGTALAEILLGDVNPSGKLPTTFAAAREDYPDFGNFPGKGGVVKYEEGIYVGYRHFDKEGIAPIFPFGYGLSYTTFEYSNLKLSQPTMSAGGTVKVSVDVTNTGKRTGEEVVQLYVHDPKPRVDKPIRELKGFAKVALKPGETKTVILTLAPRDLAYFDENGKQWQAAAGSYEIELGASSRDVRLKTALQLGATFTESISHSKQF